MRAADGMRMRWKGLENAGVREGENGARPLHRLAPSTVCTQPSLASRALTPRAPSARVAFCCAVRRARSSDQCPVPDAFFPLARTRTRASGRQSKFCFCRCVQCHGTQDIAREVGGVYGGGRRVRRCKVRFAVSARAPSCLRWARRMIPTATIACQQASPFGLKFRHEH
ncbi:hypothetical protein FA95DRAFT_1364874 [Auriscalpium vulgare]|uniref:Uncharacterized protein n=1 Tax=Auriscalpium vulgare TaxID=40419 RepID=A0ACB8RQW7_9AGAM|nr:hypothetical protein FA95DRAFT_1364874 [Auriscalpium vulgare]